MKKFLLNLWELPQRIAGIAVFLFCRLVFRMKCIAYHKVGSDKYSRVIADCYVFESKLGSAVSFGKLILVFCEQRHLDNGSVKNLIEHEYGHSVQSSILGWFYLIAIGIPSLAVTSVSSNLARRFYTETWAQRIVERIEIYIRHTL